MGALQESDSPQSPKNYPENPFLERFTTLIGAFVGDAMDATSKGCDVASVGGRCQAARTASTARGGAISSQNLDNGLGGNDFQPEP